MKISVIVPVFNVERSLLTACMRSLARQTLRADEYEVIIVDDCSDDPETLDELRKSEKGDRFRVVRHSENRGLNESRRTGAKSAQGDYIVFVDADDMLARDGLELLRMEAHRLDADVVTSGFKRWRPSSKELVDAPFFGRSFPDALNERMTAIFRCDRSFTMCGRMFRARLVTDAVFDMPDRIYHEDIVTLPRIMIDAERIGHVSKTVYYYTENEGSITTTFTEQHLNGCLTAFSEWLTLSSRLPENQYASAIRHGVERLSATMLKRCFAAENITVGEKIAFFDRIARRLSDFAVGTETAEIPLISSLLKLHEIAAHLEQTEIETKWRRIVEGHTATSSGSQIEGEAKTPLSGMARHLKGKIVFIGQVDYQVKNAALAARELRKLGHACVVLDNSNFVAGGKRAFNPEDASVFWRTEHLPVQSGPYGEDWLATAKAVITYNDFNDDIRDAIEYRQLLGAPTICAIEGINDFRRVDFRYNDSDPYRFLPYRRCDTVFLAGKNDARFFTDRDTEIVGLPIMEELRRKTPKFPKKPIAALNINFTYGVLEHKREAFLAAALDGIEQAGFDYVITQHPMDTAALKAFKVSSESQYDVIDSCSVFVSRFATGILEALASGKPAIYFNPHGERVDKFIDPLGAFEVATTVDELADALSRVVEDIAANVDFRKRGRKFLQEHTSFKLRGAAVAEQYAKAVIAVMGKRQSDEPTFGDWMFQRIQMTRSESDQVIVGEFSRSQAAQLHDEDLVARFFDHAAGVMIDVGANVGNSCDYFLGKGWTVHAFEPDPYNRNELLDTWSKQKRLIVNEAAVSDKSGDELAFYASDESRGISGLSAFTEGHTEICKVSAVSLRDYYKATKLEHTHFLKIDVEGYDKFVLDGFPWELDSPDVILVEFEDRKTNPLGYTSHDLAAVLTANGYSLYVSEWHPITQYGVQHDWRRLKKYDKDLDLSEGWGNLIAFRRDPGEAEIRRWVRETLTFEVTDVESDSVPQEQWDGTTTNSGTPTGKAVNAGGLSRARPPFYAQFGNKLRTSSPRLFLIAQVTRRLLAGLWRRKLLIITALALIGVSSAISSLSGFGILRESYSLFGLVLIANFGIAYLGFQSYQLFQSIGAQLVSLKEAGEKGLEAYANTHELRRALRDSNQRIEHLTKDLERNRVANLQTHDEIDALLVSVRILEARLRARADNE